MLLVDISDRPSRNRFCQSQLATHALAAAKERVRQKSLAIFPNGKFMLLLLSLFLFPCRFLLFLSPFSFHSPEDGWFEFPSSLFSFYLRRQTRYQWAVLVMLVAVAAIVVINCEKNSDILNFGNMYSRSRAVVKKNLLSVTPKLGVGRKLISSSQFSLISE